MGIPLPFGSEKDDRVESQSFLVFSHLTESQFHVEERYATDEQHDSVWNEKGTCETLERFQLNRIKSMKGLVGTSDSEMEDDPPNNLIGEETRREERRGGDMS